MKKFLLFALAIGVTISVSAQKTISNYNGTTSKLTSINKVDYPVSQTKIVKNVIKRNNLSTAKTNAITDITMGNAANAFGFYGNGRTYLWADNDINSVIFTHRGDVTPGSGYITIDVSTDGGATFTVNKTVYTPDVDDFAARYPQGAIYNPSGNTVAANAFATYFAPTLDGSNANWGGLAHGVQKLDLTTAATQASFTSDNVYKSIIPEAFHMTQTGVAWSVAPNEFFDGTLSYYKDTLIIYKGVFNTTTNDFDYTRQFLQVPVTTSDKMADNKIAFAPDGQTGYISIIGHDSFTFMPDSVYYPILYKTINGGATWTGPIRVDISSIAGIKAMWPDSAYLYTTGFEHDLAVDANGNPVLTFDVSVAPGGWSIATAPGYLASAVIYSADGGTNWNGAILGMLSTFRGTFTGASSISSDNRNQISINTTGTKVFMTWLDTDTMTFDIADGNYSPDIHLRGLELSTGKMTPAYNVTIGSAADGVSYMGSSSYYVFGNTGSYEIPIAYQAMDPTDNGLPVTYHYIKGFIVTDADFVSGINETTENAVSVSQNYPNPFSNTTNVIVNLTKSSDLSISVINLVGQKVVEINKGTVNAGSHTLTIDGSSLKSGIYFYTVKAGENIITRKMIVE